MGRYQSYADSILLPRVIQLGKNIYSLSFQNMKLLPAKFIIEQAIRRGEIEKDTKIIETSSGNFALGMALICQKHKLPFHVVSDPAIDNLLKNRIGDLGGCVSIVKKRRRGNYQEERLRLLQKLMDKDPKTFWTRQYDNSDNSMAYAPVADIILKNFGRDVIVVGPVGSGGSTGGTIKYLRQISKDIELIGVDTYCSSLFGLQNGPRLLRGLGNSLQPKNLEHELYDQVHWVTANEAFTSTRHLHSKKGLFCGPTTGAAYLAAKWIAKKTGKKIVLISPDDGSRYLSTVYNDLWLKNMNIKNELPEEPIKQYLPKNLNRWSYFDWNRRKFDLEPIKPYEEASNG